MASFGRILLSEHASKLDSEALDYLERMVAAARRMDTLIQDLLGCSRLNPDTGIGLAIVRRVIERMGGRVGPESELGKGSRFWIELPRDRA